MGFMAPAAALSPRREWEESGLDQVVLGLVFHPNPERVLGR